MKLTKSKLQQIIKEELQSLLEGRPFRTGVPDWDVLKHGGDLEKYPTTPEELESDRIAQELEDAWLAAGNPRKYLGHVDSEILDMAMAVRDGDMEMEDAFEQVRSLREGKADVTDAKSTEPKGATKTEKEEDKRRKRRKAKQDLKESDPDLAAALGAPAGVSSYKKEDEEMIDLGEYGPNSRSQLIDAAELLTNKLGRNLDDKDVGVLYDIAMYIRNYGTPDDKVLEKIIQSPRAFGDMPGAFHGF